MKAKKMMCGERIQRILMAFMMVVILALLSKGYSFAALVLLSFVAVMLTIYFFFDFCPSTFVLNKIFGSCYCECKDEDEKQD